MRAFCPSRFGLAEEQVFDPDADVERNEKIRVYAKRAESNQPLFPEQAESRSHLVSAED